MVKEKKYSADIKLVPVRMPEKLHKEIRHLCIDRNIYMQDWIMQAILRQLAEENKYEPKSTIKK